MDYRKLIGQLESLKENSQSFLEKGGPDSVWTEDIRALDEAMDIIHDYAQATEQAARLTAKYEMEKDVISRGMGRYQCPDCSGNVGYRNAHCHWCGRRLGWETKKRGKRPAAARKDSRATKKGKDEDNV